ncbi:MAG: glycosyltransferase [Phycisphaerales bacterium JB039]
MARGALDIIIPTYRPQAGMLAEAVASARACPEVAEVIVVDDGSDPPAAAPEGARLIRQRNTGPAGARNRGLAASTAPWALLLDDDDLLRPAGVSAMLALAERLGAVGAVAARIERSASGDRAKPAPAEWVGGALDGPGDVFRPTVLFNGSGILIRRDGQAAPLRFDQGLFVVEDRDFLRRLAELGPIAVCAEPVVIARRRDDGSNLTSARHLRRRIRGHVLLLRRYLDPGSERWLREQTLWLLRACAKARIDDGHWALLRAEARRRGWTPDLRTRLRRAVSSAGRH